VKGDRLGELEELTLLAIKVLGDDAYGVAVQEAIEREAARTVALGAVYAALDRLELKGLVRSMVSVAGAGRGGRRRRVFQVTAEGLKAVRECRRAREALWGAVPRGARGRS
jgi:DNA-binding PadR family transcriptional regulator